MDGRQETIEERRKDEKEKEKGKEEEKEKAYPSAWKQLAAASESTAEPAMALGRSPRRHLIETGPFVGRAPADRVLAGM